MLEGKKIILGITGGIAAYKATILTRLLVKSGAEVQVIMTPSAHDFVSPLTLSTLSNHPVYTQFSNSETGEWNNHVELGLWADLIIIAPASAHTLAKCAAGICDNLLVATYLSAKCPVLFAPAMDLDMYAHPSTTANLQKLASYGNIILEAAIGSLASGLVGQGRMQEPEEIKKAVEDFFTSKKKFQGKKVILTAGPTHEAIDPVRFIGNHSSGKMGYAIAAQFVKEGAEVTLISGPTALKPPLGLKQFIPVTSAQEMYEAAELHFKSANIAVMAAAVADYRPQHIAKEKIKKKSEDMALTLEKTIDIAKTLGQKKQAHQLLIGFALETENEEAHAKAKLENKNFDLIVLNSLKDENAAFGFDTNKVKIFSKNGLEIETALIPKVAVAQIILTQIDRLRP